MNGSVALVNGRIVLPDRLVEDRALLVEGGRIAAVAAPGDLPTDLPRVDLNGDYLAPGMIDIHTHGAMGRSFLDGDDAAFEEITRAQASRGVTGLLATTSTAPMEQILTCLQRTREWMESGRGGSQVLGSHVEGPYFDRAQAGAQDPGSLRTPDDGSVDELLEYGDAIRIISYAPELPGAMELTARLVRLGIVAAAGHSSAEDHHLHHLVEAGLSHIIHLWSGQSTTVRKGPYRHPGLLEASLASDDLSAEMIADGKHLPDTLMKLAYKCFGPDRLCLISDATSGAGLTDGARFRMGEMEYEVHDGVGMMLDRSGFAGSTTFLSEMVPLVRDRVRVPLAEAVRMASLTPARTIGVGDCKGSIETGKDADLVVLTGEELTPRRVMIGGRWIDER